MEHVAESARRASGFEKGEHGYDPAIVLALLDQAEFLKDRADVLLDSAVTQCKGFGRWCGCSARSPLLEHLALTVGEAEQRRRLFLGLMDSYGNFARRCCD